MVVYFIKLIMVIFFWCVILDILRVRTYFCHYDAYLKLYSRLQRSKKKT